MSNEMKNVFAIPVDAKEKEEIAKIADKVVDLMGAAGLTPDRLTLVALLTIVANNHDALADASVSIDELPAGVREKIETARATGRTAVGEYTPEPAGDLDEFLRNPPRRGATKVGKDGLPMFMAPMSKTSN